MEDSGALLPLIAAFFEASVLQREARQKSVEAIPLTRISSIASSTSMQMDDRFSSFVSQHRTLLNAIIRQNPALLDGAFGSLIKLPGALDFDNKRAWFRSQVRKRRDRSIPEMRLVVRRYIDCIQICIYTNRNRVMDDSYQQFRQRNKDELRGKLVVNFDREEGIDAGLFLLCVM